jgi:hypothetical protein
LGIGPVDISVIEKVVKLDDVTQHNFQNVGFDLGKELILRVFIWPADLVVPMRERVFGSRKSFDQAAPIEAHDGGTVAGNVNLSELARSYGSGVSPEHNPAGNR